MFTATDLRDKLKTLDACPGLDGWIESYLVTRFHENTSSSASVPSAIIHSMKWSRRSFEKSMQQRGFYVEYACEDRPCGGCYFKIAIPPEGE